MLPPKLQQLLDAIPGQESISPTHLSLSLQQNRVTIHLGLKELLRLGKIEKVGLGTHVSYRRLDGGGEQIVSKDLQLGYTHSDIINRHFYKFSDQGKLLEGISGFQMRFQERNLDPQQKAEQFLRIYTHIQSLKNDCGLINTTQILNTIVSDLAMNACYYADQYNWMEFGRGKLAEMTFYAKQSQNLRLINQSLDYIQLQLECLVRSESIDAIAITPRSITRHNQLLKILKYRLGGLGKPFITIVKHFPNRIPIPQKSLKTREQRIRNAQSTIFVEDNNVEKYKKVLLIDDFVGSGATLNETAKKLKISGAKQVIGFAFVGNMNLSYEVINEI